MLKLRKTYSIGQRTKRVPRRFWLLFGGVLALIIAGMIGIRVFYNINLGPVSKSAETQTIVVNRGATVDEVANELKAKNLIRNSLVFQLYIRSKESKNPLIAGTYKLQPSLSTPQIVSILSDGKVATDLVTILPGQRIDQIRKSLINSGFKEVDVDKALDPQTYKDNPALVDKPAGAGLEGYLYPESFQKTSTTKPQEIVEESLNLMNKHLTPSIRAAFAKQGLDVYQGITLASVVEQEAYRPQDRGQIAQVFLSRLTLGMALQSDPTAKYGALKDQRLGTSTYQASYSTYAHTGLPPSPISNVSAGSLEAVANPAPTDWLYFVAGDDGTTHFSHTLEEHQQLTQQYCTKLCGN
jgi:UPF0755 protein